MISRNKNFRLPIGGTEMPKKKAEKLILIGIDSMMMKRIDKFAKEGRLPNISKIMSSGVASLAYPTIPTTTGPNWTTIATGADSSTHGVFNNNFNSSLCQAERLWQAAERVGRKSILLRYPGGWPPTVEDGIVLGTGQPASSPWVICYSKCYSTEKLRRFTGEELIGPRLTPIEVKLTPAEDWRNLPNSFMPLLQTDIQVNPYRRGGTSVTLHALIWASKPDGYDKTLIARTKNAAIDTLSEMRVGQWSEFITKDFAVSGEPRAGTFRFKLLNLSPDASKFTLYRSQVHATEDFSFPPEIAKELVAECGPFFDNPNRLLLALGRFDNYFEELDYHASWLSKAAAYLMDKYNFDLFFMQCHSPDYVEHECLGGIDPISGRYDEDKAGQWWEIFAKNYEIIDKMVGKIRQYVDDSTLIVLVSNHGHLMHIKNVLLVNALADAGLIAVDEGGSERSSDRIPSLSEAKRPLRIDRENSKVFPVGHGFISVNLAGREENGIVEPGTQYESVRSQVIDVLYSLRDEERGGHPISLALRKEEAGIIGLVGEKVPGDIVVICAPGYGKEPGFWLKAPEDFIIGPNPSYGVWGGSEGMHGHLPSAELSEGTIQATFIISGPGIKTNYRRPKPLFLRDVAPTIAHLMGIPIPKDADGRVLFDIFEE